MNDLLRFSQLLWSPVTLHKTARRSLSLGSIFVGATAICLEVACMIATGSVFGLEPFEDLHDVVVTWATLLVAIAIAMLGALIYIIGGWCLAIGYKTRIDHYALLHVVVLSPLTILVPTLLWGVCATISKSSSSSQVQFYGMHDTPQISDAMLLVVIGSDWVLLIIAVLWVANTAFALYSVRRHGKPIMPQCRQCGYPLIGLTSKHCPECGCRA